MPNRQCAPCRSPASTLSRTVAHEASRETSTLTPCFLYRPNSCAITTEAQSVRGMIPSLILLPAGDFAASEPFVAQELTSVDNKLAALLAATTFPSKVRPFLLPLR